MSQNFYFKLIVPIILCCSTWDPRSGRSSTEKSIQGGLYCISGFLHLSGMDVNIPEMNCCHSVKTNLITNSPSLSFNISFYLSSSIIIGVRIGGELLRDKSSCNQHCLFWFEFRLLETAAPRWAERLLPSLSLSVSLFFSPQRSTDISAWLRAGNAPYIRGIRHETLAAFTKPCAAEQRIVGCIAQQEDRNKDRR